MSCRSTVSRMAAAMAGAAALSACLFGFAGTASAVPVNFSFTGVANASILNLGGGDINIPGGTGFTVTGMTLNDTDQESANAVGLYDATATYDFGALLGSFTTDSTTGLLYLQNATDLANIDTVGLTDLVSGFSVVLSSTVPGNPNGGAVPLGGPLSPSSTSNVPGTMTNGAGHSLTLDISQINSFSVTAKVPEPGTLAILGFGLLGFGLARRRGAA